MRPLYQIISINRFSERKENKNNTSYNVDLDYGLAAVKLWQKRKKMLNGYKSDTKVLVFAIILVYLRSDTNSF